MVGWSNFPLPHRLSLSLQHCGTIARVCDVGARSFSLPAAESTPPGCTFSFGFIFVRPHPHPLNGPLSGTTQVSRYQKGKTNLYFTGARDSEWQWHQLGHMQVRTSLQTDNNASTLPLRPII